jgi:type IV pilus assembly protein PilB
MVLPDDQFLELITKENLVDAKSLPELQEYAKSADRPLAEILVEKNLLTDEQVGTLIANQLQVPFINLKKLNIPENAFNIIPEKFARVHKMIAFERTPEEIKIASADPNHPELIEPLSKKTGTKVTVYYATDVDIALCLRSYKKDLQKSVDDMLKEDIWSLNSALEDPPVAKIVDQLIDTAYRERSSDIHIEPMEDYSLTRFRVDGILHDVLRVPKYLHDRIITRIKVLSNLRTDEHLSAQDGKMRISLEEENLDIRVSILPVVDGEKAVLRLLASKMQEYSFASLGMNETDLAKVTKAFSQSYGMVLSTGPTGSGKTTSIYSILKILNTRDRNITTIEDPVEYKIKGANQIHVNVKTNLTFANGLRAILRQDPNVVFVGEIRDGETAGIAVNAALTGHLVVSTLHTNDAAGAIPRLSDMKVEPFLVASTVSIIIAQRLVRHICDQCKQSSTITSEELIKNFPSEVVKRAFGSGKTLNIYKGKGCKLCRGTGYSGRVGIFEVLAVTKTIKKLIVEKAEADIIAREAAKEGMKTMLEDGLEKVARGITTIEEILRVTKSEFMG